MEIFKISAFTTLYLTFNILAVSSEWSFNKWYVIKNVETGLVVDASTGYATLQVEVESDALLSPFQRWQPQPAEEVGVLYLKNNGSNVRNYLLADPTGAIHKVLVGAPVSMDYIDSYQWYVDSDGTIKSAHMELTLDLWNPSGAEDFVGSSVIADPKTGEKSQQFVFEEIKLEH